MAAAHYRMDSIKYVLIYVRINRNNLWLSPQSHFAGSRAPLRRSLVRLTVSPLHAT